MISPEKKKLVSQVPCGYTFHAPNYELCLFCGCGNRQTNSEEKKTLFELSQSQW